MKIEKENNKIIILDPIVTINDAEKVKNTIKEIAQNHNNIEIEIKNSFAFPSSIISLLEKLKDSGKNIYISVHDDILYELFNDLNLTKSFHIRKQ